MLQIFLAHAKEDEERVSSLYKRLKEKGYDPWLDKEDLLPGQNWRVEIPKAIKNSQIFIACLSQRSVAKQGYIQREFRMALNEYANRPPNSIYLLPLRLDNCSIPDLRQEEYGVNLRDIQWVDLFEANGFDRLVRALEYSFPESQSLPSTVVSTRSLNLKPLGAREGQAISSKVENLTSHPSALLTTGIDSTREQNERAVLVGERLSKSHTLSTTLVTAPKIASIMVAVLLGLTTVGWLGRSLQPPVQSVPDFSVNLELPAQIEIAFEQNKVDVATALTEELIKQGKYADAITALDTAKPRQRKDVIVAFLKGRSQWGLAEQADSGFEPGDAMRSWMTALEDEPDWMEISMALGFAQLATGREDLALESWRKAIKLAEKQPDGKGMFSDQPASEYVLNAYAGRVIAALSLSNIDSDPTERGRLMNEASESYRKVINEAPADFGNEALASNWLWLEEDIVRWEEAKAELSQTLK